MKLDAMQRPNFVAHSHDLIFLGPRGDDKIIRKGAGTNHEAVIARRIKGIGHADKNALIVMENRRSFTVHQAVIAFDHGPKGMADELMSQANSQNRNSRPKAFENIIADAGLTRGAWAGRNNNPFNTHAFNLINGNPVVANNFNGAGGVDLTEPLHEVVREGVVIINE